MALELESTIMQEIGLGMNYNWFNGSGSCLYIRQDAAKRLSAAIEKHATAEEKIVAPDASLMTLISQATRWDTSDYELTKFWQIASYVIAWHIRAAYQSADEQVTSRKELIAYIRKTYQSERDMSRHTDTWMYR